VAVLRSLHFTIVMNPGRRLAHYAADNIDGAHFVKAPRGRDQWMADALLPRSLQIEAALVSQSPYDRGQIVARGTVSWGDTREAWIAAHQAPS
jgi:endonuclease G, mitochondrial